MAAEGDESSYEARFVADFNFLDRRLAELGGLDYRLHELSKSPGELTRFFESTDGGTGYLHSFTLGESHVVIEMGSDMLTAASLLNNGNLRQRSLIALLGALIVHSRFGGKEGLVFTGIARALVHARESMKMPLDSLSAELKVWTHTISNWEQGQSQPLKLSTLYRWCQALGLVCPPKTALVHTVDFSPKLLRFLQEDPARLRQLSPDEFERFVGERLDRMGFNVKLTGSTNRKDGGIDLIAVPRESRLGSYVIAGQVKHHRGDQATGVEAVDRLLAWQNSVFRSAFLVTNTSFTRDAVWKAQKDGNSNFLRLRDFNDLKRWLQGQWGTEDDWREIPDHIELAPGVVIEVPKPRITTDLGKFKIEE